MTTVFTLHRLEPISREGDPGRGLAAPVHDPLWGLARQRQFGELAGEDTGSPVKVTFQRHELGLDGWRPAGSAEEPQAYDPARQVLEAIVGGETPGPVVSVRDRVEAGRRLSFTVAAGTADALRAKFPIAVDPAKVQGVVRRAAPLVADGIAVVTTLAEHASDADAALAAALGLPVADLTAARPALEAFAAWASTTFGLGPTTWEPTRLERRFEITAAGTTALVAPAHTREIVDAADLELAPALATLPEPAIDPEPIGRIPTVTRFPGMPNDRFWEFEDAQLSLARIDAATHDLARLALVEFSAVYGNDWFTFPIPLTFGTLLRIPEILVRDTFGRHELVAHVDEQAWSMFSPTRADGVPPHLVAPALMTGSLAGPYAEDVAFVRDENANLVWGLERLVTDEAGRVRDLVAEYSADDPARPALPTDAELLYRLMTDVPEHWVPFIPVHIDATNRAVGLVEALLPRPTTFGEPVVTEAKSTVLRELKGVVLHEEEVPSAGVVVRRRWYLARSADGGRHVWAARTVTTGRGEGASGLAFDVTLDIRGR